MSQYHFLSGIFQVKKESAETEKAWVGSGQKPGVEVWRINKFKVSWTDATHLIVKVLAIWTVSARYQIVFIEIELLKSNGSNFTNPSTLMLSKQNL